MRGREGEGATAGEERSESRGGWRRRDVSCARQLRTLAQWLVLAGLAGLWPDLQAIWGGGAAARGGERASEGAEPSGSRRGVTSPQPAPRPPRGTAYEPDGEPPASAGRAAAGAACGKLAIHLTAPMRGQWRLIAGEIDPRELRLDVRLGPRHVPKHRMPRGTLLQAERGTTWIEFIGGPLDDVLRLRIDCRTDKLVDVVVTPYVQPGSTGGSMRYTEFAERRLDQLADVAAQRAEIQLRLLGAVPAKDGKSAPRGGGALTPAGIRAKMLADYQYQAARETQKRLAHLDRLREQLDGVAELEVRVLRADGGAPVPIVEAASTSALAENLRDSYGGRSASGGEKGRARKER